jgi:hypothetical protein
MLKILFGIVGDINCEFRVIVALLGKGVELWSTILHDLVRKPNTNHKDSVELEGTREGAHRFFMAREMCGTCTFILLRVCASGDNLHRAEVQKKVVIY